MWTMVVWLHYGPVFTLFGCTFTSEEGWMSLPIPLRWLISFAGAAKALSSQWTNLDHTLRNPPLAMIHKLNALERHYLVFVIPLSMGFVSTIAIGTRVYFFGPSDPISALACRAISSVFS